MYPCTVSEFQTIHRQRSLKNFLRAFTYYMLLAGLLFVIHYFRGYYIYWEFMDDSKTIAFLIAVCSCYFVFTVIQALLLKYPNIHNLYGINDESQTNKHAIIVIACHNSAEEIKITLESILHSFDSHRVFIADNNSCNTPPDNTREICIECGIPEYNYRYYNVSCKCEALYKTTQYAIDRFKHVEDSQEIKYVALIDDDTILPNNFRINTALFESKSVSAITYGIQTRKGNLVEQLTDWEYKLFCWRNYWKSKYSTVKLAVGIFNVWRIDRFMLIYSQNYCRYPGLPFGEDGWAGYINRRYNYRIVSDLSHTVTTYSPSRLWPSLSYTNRQGYNANSLWKQRVYRWYRNYPRRLPLELYLLFTYNAGSVFRNVLYRLDVIYGIFLFFGSLTIPVLIMRVILSREDIVFWFILHSSMFVSSMFSSLVINYVTLRNRPEIQAKFIVILVYPFYTIWISFARLFGAISSILWYIPWYSPYNK